MFQLLEDVQHLELSPDSSPGNSIIAWVEFARFLTSCNYILQCFLILVRKWHQRSDLGRSDKWEFEVGQTTTPRAPTDLLTESLSNVRAIIVRPATLPIQGMVGH